MIRPIITFIITLAGFACTAQSFQTEYYHADSVEYYKADIDRYKHGMDDSLALWVTEEYNYDCDYYYGSVTLFLANGKLRLLRLRDTGEYGEIIKLYYFDSGKVFYVFVKGDTWALETDQVTGKEKKIYTREEKYIYLYQEKAFDCRSKELSYYEDKELEDFNTLEPAYLNCEWNNFLQEALDLFPCYPFKDFRPCLCSD